MRHWPCPSRASKVRIGGHDARERVGSRYVARHLLATQDSASMRHSTAAAARS